MYKNISNYLASAFTFITSFLTEDVVTSYILFGLGVLSALCSIALTIFKWYKLAKADGEITPEEIEKGIEEVKNTIDEEKNKF